MMLYESRKQDRQEKVSRAQKVLFGAYILLIIALVIMFGARFCSLCARKDFRKNTVTYPSQCSEWAQEGCTYISLN